MKFSEALAQYLEAHDRLRELETAGLSERDRAARAKAVFKQREAAEVMDKLAPGDGAPTPLGNVLLNDMAARPQTLAEMEAADPTVFTNERCR